MNAYIALLRGINVSGHNSIKMADLRQMLTDTGLKNVVTYIQSGNIVFSTDETSTDVLEDLISKTIEEKYGYQINVLIMDRPYLKKVFNELPFNKMANFDFKKLGVTFLKDIPLIKNISKIEALKKGDEHLVFNDKVAYLYCPNGFGKTKLSNTNFETKLKTSATSRNWRTITKLLELSC
jgi:uncharacterized protein (DUF1697 family)